jgi:hypothetical protein
MPEHIINQTELCGAIFQHLADQGIEELEPRCINAVIKAADAIKAECERESVKATAGMGLMEWLASDDTGLSSKFMAHVLCGRPKVCDETRFPWDPSDFGRCHRFLEAVPNARESLDAMRQHGPVWAAYVDHWQEMTDLYLAELPTGSCPKLYELMKRLQREAAS